MNPNMDVSYEQVRSLVMEALAADQKATQFALFHEDVARIAVRHSFLKENDPRANILRAGPFTLSRHDQARVQNILWDLIIEGIVRPGSFDGVNNNLPFFHVTEYGRAVLKDGPASPYDPDGYLQRLKTAIGNLDGTILTYLNESSRTFRIGCLLSSTVALGCASEKAFVLLVAAYADSLPEKMQGNFIKNTEGRTIKRQCDEFQKMLDSELKARLPADLKEGLDIILNGVFSMIRSHRNDAGHPTGRSVDREEAYVNLNVFPSYLKRVYGLINWLKNNPRSA
jgi:hypothetical protein